MEIFWCFRTSWHFADPKVDMCSSGHGKAADEAPPKPCRLRAQRQQQQQQEQDLKIIRLRAQNNYIIPNNNTSAQVRSAWWTQRLLDDPPQVQRPGAHQQCQHLQHWIPDRDGPDGPLQWNDHGGDQDPRDLRLGKVVKSWREKGSQYEPIWNFSCGF